VRGDVYFYNLFPDRFNAGLTVGAIRYPRIGRAA